MEFFLHDPNPETPRKTSSDHSKSSPLLPAAEISSNGRSSPVEIQRSQVGLEIERPGSALHSGDFTQGTYEPRNSRNAILSADSKFAPNDNNSQNWLATPPPQDSPFHYDLRFPPADQLDSDAKGRFQAPSLSSSFASSFVLKAPTSPLVQSESNDDLDLSSMNPIDITPESRRNARRHTLQASQPFHSIPSLPTNSSFNRPMPPLRRDSTFPYQAHQPRRSLASNQMPHSISSPQTPNFLRSRRPSFSSDTSPLHASMVGSYEESILRGRMSTTPSKPLDFVAQIGVLGLGKCKSNLRCPAHVTIPFPAVFYSYETTSHGRTGRSEEGPSPYVGQIDLENSLSNPDESRDIRRKRRVERSQTSDLELADLSHARVAEREIRRAEKQKRRSTSPRAPPGGSYRIPEKGQLQIIIKNPNKTAVKLFLVPYDLTGMEPGTKTFIRQRSYSAGPIIDSPLTSSPRLPSTYSLDRVTLRYLVHLHICSPSRGRFYLYKSIRVVFANRVPDGKEKLRNEISMPEPRFSVYKPGRDNSLGIGLGSAGASLAAEKAFRRRSSGFPLTPSHRGLDAMDGITHALEGGLGGGLEPGYSQQPVQPIPFSFAQQPYSGEDEFQGRPRIQSPTSSNSRPETSQGSDDSPMMSWDGSSGISGYDKLNKGDIGYGGNAFSSPIDGKQLAESLLAKKLRDLGVQQQDHLDNM